MSNQTKDSSFKLNPAANEFVPNFGSSSGSSGLTSNSSYQPAQQINDNSKSYSHNNYQNQHYSNNYQNRNFNNNRSNNSNYSNNNRYNNSRNNNYNSSNNYNNRNSNSNYYGNNYRGGNKYHYQNDPNVDPIEMEARCEAVIEILQDDNLRSLVDPSLENNSNSPQNDENLDQFDDEEEMMEMMAMQEECRMEMMKFYVQSQNPNLFEELYHDVSYPEGQEATGQPSQSQTQAPIHQQPRAQEQQQADDESSSSSSSSTLTTTNQSQSDSQSETKATSSSSSPLSSASSTNSKSIKDIIVNDLNTEASEFDPSKLVEALNINDKN